MFYQKNYEEVLNDIKKEDIKEYAVISKEELLEYARAEKIKRLKEKFSIKDNENAEKLLEEGIKHLSHMLHHKMISHFYLLFY